MLEVHNLVKTYKSKSGVTVKALDEVSLKLPVKGMVFILGKSGSGKSTLLNVLGGLDGFDSGEFYVKGKQINSFKQSDFDSYRNTYVGFIFQEYNIIDDFTVGQNIALAMQLQGRKPVSEDINAILKEVDLEGLGDRKPNELSGGQKQRVAIARALIKKPQIIMADEPTGALDSNTGIQIFDTLKKLSKDKLVLIVSHDREFSERYADRIIEIKDGKILSDVENTAKGGEAKQEGITCVGDTVIVREDYVLKQSDLKIINDYLKNCKKGAKIKTGTGLKSKSTFKNTNQDNIKMDKSGFQLIKSKLPLKYAVKMGMKGLGHKKFKLVLTIFLSVISFGMLGMSTSMMFFDGRSSTVDTFYASNINFASLANRTDNSNYSSYNLPMEREDFNKIKEDLPGVNAKFILTGGNSGGLDWYSNISEPDFNRNACRTSFTGVTSIDSDTDLVNNFGFTYYKEEGAKKPGNDEIIISLYVADCLINEGYKNSAEAVVQSYDGLIGQELKLNLDDDYLTDEKYKIVNIVDTGFMFGDSKFSQIYASENYYSDPHFAEFQSYKEHSLASVLFVNENTMADYESKHPTIYEPYRSQNYAIFKMSHDKQDISKIVNYSFDSKRELSDKEKELYPNANYASCVLTDELSNRVANLTNTLSTLKQVFLYIGLAFVVFSGLLLANFIANSISYQKKEIGILRAIGSRSSDVFKIYYSESLFIAIINFVIASIGAWAVMTFALIPSFTNMLGGVTLISFGIIPVLIILGVALVSTFIATLVPVNLTARKKPIEAIRNK